MEEKKSKLMPLKTNATGLAQSEKMSYEQLVNIASQLQSQNKELMMRMNNISNIYHRLDYLFKVLENATQFSKDFITKCAKEVEEIMTIPDPSEQNKEEEKKEN